jgi:predicted Zn-dependent protease
MPDNLKREFEYYRAHQEEIVKQYAGRYVVIKDQKVIGHYGDQLTAITETSKHHEPGTFLVQKAEPGNIQQTFHTRVAFR